jgi:hypothetical protein
MKKALFALLCAGMLALGGCAANTVQEEKAPLPETSEAEVTESTESIESTESAEVSEKVEITL